MSSRVSLSRTTSAASASSAADVVRHDDPRLSAGGLSGWSRAYPSVTNLQSLVDGMSASGGVLHLERDQTYTLTSALTVRNFLEIEGNGAHIVQSSSSAKGLVGVDITGLVLRNVTIRRSTPQNGTGKGISLTLSSNAATVGLIFENVTVRDFGSDGIEISNPIVSSFVNVTARNNAGHGWNIHGVPGGAAGTSSKFDVCYADSNLQSGFRLENMVYTGLNSCAADLNGINYEIIGCQSVQLGASGCETPVNRSASYPGHNVVIRGGFGIVLDALWTYESLTTSLWVTDSARGVVVRSMAENSPQAAATHCIRVDSGCRVTIEDCNNVRPYNLAAGTTTILNDGGGLSVPGYVYGASTAYFEGEIGTSVVTPTYDQAVTTRGWVNARLSERVPLGQVNGGGEWDRQVYGDIISTGHRDDSTSTLAMSASIRTLVVLLGKLPAGQAVTGFRMARSVAAVGGAASAALFFSPTSGSTSWTRASLGNVTPVLTGTGLISTAYAVAAASVDQWWMLQFTLTTAPTTYPTFLATPVISLAGFASQSGSLTVVGSSSSTAAPGATLNPTTGWTLSTQKIWASLY